MRSTGNLADRFQAKVGQQLPNGCMEWQGFLQPNGYGVFGFAKRGRALTHRLAYSLVHGPIPQGMVVMHKCDNPRCVNVEHLRLGTQAENVADMVAKGRARRSRLLPYLHDIRRLRAEGYSHSRIAQRYGVSRPLVSLLLGGVLQTN